MLRRLRQTLRAEGGQAALETIVCFPFMIIVVVCFWAAMIVVYNQTVLNSASQVAAQGALTVYDRESYRGGVDSTYNPLGDANTAANVLLQQNATGMLTEQFGGGKPTPPTAAIHLFCGSDPSNLDAVAPCGNSGAAVERAHVDSSSASGYWLMSGLFNAIERERHVAPMTSTGDAVSVAPQ